MKSFVLLNLTGILLFFSFSFAQSEENFTPPKASAYTKQEKNLTLGEEMAIDKYKEAIQNGENVSLDDLQKRHEEKEPFLIQYAFPFFFSLIGLFILMMFYNYMLGATADRGKVLKELEEHIKNKEERDHTRTLKKYS